MDGLSKKLLAALLAALMLLAVFAGCSKEAEVSSEALPEESEANAGQVDSGEINFEQLDPVKSGDTVAVMKVSGAAEGTIRIKLFPEYAPQTVESFVTLAGQGYYNGLTFQDVQENLKIQSEALQGADSGDYFEDDLHMSMRNYHGALAMEKAADGNRLYIVQADTSLVSEALVEQMKGADLFPDKVIAKYQEVGGIPNLDWRNVVFGQVVEGMDVVDAIAAVEIDETNKPTETVMIESVTIETA